MMLTYKQAPGLNMPQHGIAVHEQYLRLSPGDEIVADLIERDMDFHTCRGEELDALCMHPYAASFYLAAWAEIMLTRKCSVVETAKATRSKQAALRKREKSCEL